MNLKLSKHQVVKEENLFRMSKFIFKGVFLHTVNGAHGKLMECQGKKSVEDFKTCILQSSDSFIRDISLKSYKQETHLNEFQKLEMIFPEDGSVGVKISSNATLYLDPLFVYMICFFDKNFLFYVLNPLIVPRSCITISQNSSFTPIPLKVGMSLKQDLLF